MNGYPPFFPTPPRYEEQSSDAVASETECSKEGSWCFYPSEISLLRLRRRIANEAKNFEPENSTISLTRLATIITEHEEQILEWAHALRERVSLAVPSGEDDVCRFVLRGHLSNVYEMLYWPFVDCAMSSLSSYNDTPLLAELANKGLQKHVDRINTNRPGFQHRHHGTFGMIVSCTRSALVLLAAGQGRDQQFATSVMHDADRVGGCCSASHQPERSLGV
jgi:hypothetical protein